MTRKKVKLAWVANDNSRTISLKKRRLGLLKKVRELTILCDVKACLIMFSPNEVEPMVWPSIEGARNLLHGFFALPEIEKKKKELSLEKYLKEKTMKVHDQVMKSHKKNIKFNVDQLMVQLHSGRSIDDLNLSDICDMLSSLYSNIMVIRKRLDFMEHPSLRQPPVHPLFEARPQEFRTTRNNVFIAGRHGAERRGRTREALERICIDNIKGNQTHYLMDQWIFASPEPPNHARHQQNNMEMASYNENPNIRSYHPQQGSSSYGVPNLEMEQMMNFRGTVGPVSHSLQHHNMDINPNMVMNQPRQYPFDFISGVKEEWRNIHNDGTQFDMNNYNGLHQEPPLNPNGATTDEGIADVTSFDISRTWPGFINPHF